MQKRYKNYFLAVAIYAGFFGLASIVYGEGYFFTLEGQLMFFEDLFLPGSVLIINFLWDKFLKKRGIEFSTGRRVLLKTTLSLLVIFMASSFTNELEKLIGFVDDDFIAFGSTIELDAYWSNTVTNLLLVLIIGIPLFYREAILDKKERNLILQGTRVNTLTKELDVLKTQLHSANVKPHFIFNTLNSIVSLIEEDPQKAESLVIHLSDFLRQSIYSSNENHHSLLDELSSIANYLGIEKIRFGDEVDFTIQKDEGLPNVIVPKFFLLPIVENAIKHNRLTKNLTISVNIKKSEHGFKAEVQDNGEKFPEKIKWNAGVEGTNALLRGFYQGGYKIEFLNTPLKMVRMHINLEKNG
jgi:hypothetical protein